MLEEAPIKPGRCLQYNRTGGTTTQRPAPPQHTCPTPPHHTHPPTCVCLQQLLPHIVIHRQVAEQEVGQLQGIALKLSSLQGNGGPQLWVGMPSFSAHGL
jgi:hypothetical protein